MSLGSIDGVFGQIIKKFSFFGNKAMSSSYVEVRESENGTGGDFLQQLGINNIMATDSNGIDVQARFDAELPKDHTYNKDPGNNGDKEASPEGDSKSEEVEESPRRTGRAHRNIKHKIIKPRTEETIVKKDNSKKPRPKAIVEPLGKRPTRERSKSPIKNKVLAEVNNASAPAEPELSSKKDRKRKIGAADPEVKEKVDDIKQQGTKRAKATPEKEANPTDLKKEVVVDVKKKLPVKKSKGGKAKGKELKNPKVELPKSASKPVVKDVGEISSDLPTGWTRKIVERKSGKTAGMFDIYIYSPEGIKFRSRPDIAAYLERTNSKLSVEKFSFKRSLGESSASNNVKKPVSKAVKVENEGSSRKKKVSSPLKSVKKLKVKIGTPKKRGNKVKVGKKEKVYPFIDCKPSTSGLQSKRIGANRKKKYT